MLISKVLKVVSNLIKYEREQGEGQVSAASAFS